MTGTMADSACSYAALIEHLTPVSRVRVFGLDAHERLRRSFAKFGLGIVEADEVEKLGHERVVALRTSHFYDDRLVAELTAHSRNLLLLSDEGEDAPVPVGVVGTASRIACLITAIRRGEDPRAAARAADVAIAFPTDVLPSYDAKLRKHSPPFVLPADPERTRELEDRIFDAAYKGVTDFVTKWVWPVPAKIVTRWCARFGISPNTITLLSYGLTLAALLAFWHGEFAAGLVTAWMMTFLDTVDGKLARVTLTASKLGDVLDHGLDLIHPPFWWAAWGAGLAGAGTHFGEFEGWVIVVFVGYIVGRLLEGLFILSFGQEMFTWRPFDLAFRLVIARRNPNLVLLTGATIFGRPDLGLIAVGIWTLCCILIQSVRIAQATTHRLRGREILPYSG
jgi:hypothetical protein